jgi:hypothetical protein
MNGKTGLAEKTGRTTGALVTHHEKIVDHTERLFPSH